MQRVETWLASDDEGVPDLTPCVNAPPWLIEARRISMAIAPGPEGQRFVVVLFAGPPNRPGGLAAELRRLGAHVVEVDVLIGNRLHDLTDTSPDGIGWYLLRAATNGAVDAVYTLHCRASSTLLPQTLRTGCAMLTISKVCLVWHRATPTG